MLRSLVGSEMCIRDSLTSTTTLPALSCYYVLHDHSSGMRHSVCPNKTETNSLSTWPVRGRIREAMGILKKLHRFMRHSNCKIRFKLNVVQAVLFSKILFGLESAELPMTSLKALDVFHLKCLHKLLKLNTTFVNRNNTNAEVLRKANQHLPEKKKDQTT